MNQTRQWLLLAGVGVLLLLVVVVFLILLAISAVYRRLHEGLNQISRKNFAYRFPLYSSDETGILFSAFNQTAAQLQKQTKAKNTRTDTKTNDTDNRSSRVGEQVLRKTEITCLVARIPGIQEQITATEPEMIEEYLTAFMQPLDKVVREYGGQVAEILGDKVYAFFEGINCIDNGIRAALKLMQYWQTVNHERKVLGRKRHHYAIGLHATETIAGSVSRSFSHYTFIGQAAALAAYLCARAGSEQIWASSAMMDKTSGAYPYQVRTEVDLSDVSPENNVLEISPSDMTEAAMAFTLGNQPAESFVDGRHSGADALSETFGFDTKNRSHFESSITDMLEETLVSSPLETLKAEEKAETVSSLGGAVDKKSLWDGFDAQKGSAED
jgi:class 3 adenylate cyclase